MQELRKGATYVFNELTKAGFAANNALWAADYVVSVWQKSGYVGG